MKRLSVILFLLFTVSLVAVTIWDWSEVTHINTLYFEVWDTSAPAGDNERKIAATNLAKAMTFNASNVTAGVFPPARLGTGTPDSSTYLRGDGTFQAIPGGGDMLKSVYDANTDSRIDVASGGTGATNAAGARTALGLVIGTDVEAHDTTISKLGSTIEESELNLADNTTNNVSASRHGFAPKLPGNTTTFLRGDGTFATPSGSGDMLRSTYDPDTDGIISVAQGGTGGTTAAAARSNLGLVPGTDVQGFDAELAAWAGLTSAADTLGYFTGSGTASTTPLTSFARSILDDTSAAAVRSTIGAGTGNGTVTSVSITAPSQFSVSGNPLTTAGSIAITWTGRGTNVSNLAQAVTVDASGNIATAGTVSGILNGSQIESGTVSQSYIDSAIARVDSPAFTGTPTAPTQAVGNNSTRLATTAWVISQVASYGYLTGTSPLNGDNVTSGTVADARIPSGIARDSEVAAGYQPLDADLSTLASLTGNRSTNLYNLANYSTADASGNLNLAGKITPAGGIDLPAGGTNDQIGLTISTQVWANTIRDAAGTGAPNFDHGITLGGETRTSWPSGSSGSATNVFGIDIDSFSTNGTPTCIWTGTVATATSSRVQVQVTGAGPTNSASYNLDGLFRRGSGNVAKTATNNVSTLESDSGMFAYLDADTTDQAAKLWVGGLTNEQFHWLAKGWQWSLTNHAVTEAALSYLISEDFEGVGTPTGWTNVSSANFDYTTGPIAGSESLYSQQTPKATVSVGGVGEIEVFFKAKAADYANGPYLIWLMNSAGAYVARVSVLTTSAVRVNAGSTYTTSTGAFATDSVRCVWIYYKKGTGANGVVEVFVSSDTTKPGSPSASGTTDSKTDDVAFLSFYTGVTANNVLIDTVRVSTSGRIGSNP